MQKFPTKKYKILLADPPWLYGKFSNTEGSRLYNYDPKFKITPYDGMPIEQIKALPVETIAEKDSVLCLWVTMPCLKWGIEVIESWGFNYKTVLFTWVKKNKNVPGYWKGLGYYTRANAEIVMLGTRGKGIKVINKGVGQIIDSPISKHSRKPDIVRQRILKLFGDLPRIELFARTKIHNWDTWGDDQKLNLQPLENYSLEESESGKI